MLGKVVSLQAGDLSVRVASTGAELQSLSWRQQELLWQGDERWWAKHSPILFPVIGRVRGGEIVVDGVRYPMPLHGFASSSEFSLIQRTDDSCVMRLCSGPSSRAHFPFEFELQLSYRLKANELRLTATVRNPGERALPASFGFHPGFVWPLVDGTAKTEHELVFPDDTNLCVGRLNRAGLLLAAREDVALTNHALPLAEELFAPGAMIITGHASRRFIYRTRRSRRPSLELDVEGLPHLGLWMWPGADFLCIEPWHGFSDPAIDHGCYFQKPGLFTLLPGEARIFAMTVTIT